MLVVFFGLGVAAASILGGLGKVLDASKPHSPMNVAVRKHASQKCSSCDTTTVLTMFYRLRTMPHTAAKHVSCVAFKTFLDMVHELLQKFLAGIHFLLFKTTLQRGGTCEAHGIRRLPKGEPCVLDSKHWNLLYCLPLRLAFRIRLQIPSSKAFPHPFVPSPGPARTAALRPQFALEASKCDF